jgi:hypothetical protein
MRQIRTSGSMSEGGKRNHGRIEAPLRCESRRTQLLPDPTVTAPVLDSTVRKVTLAAMFDLPRTPPQAGVKEVPAHPTDSCKLLPRARPCIT